MAQRGKSKQTGEEAAPPRRRNTRAVGYDTGHVIATAMQRKGFRDPTLVLRWAEIVGPEVARIARPIKFSEGAQGGLLTLRAEPAASLFLQHESRAICGRINAYLGRFAVSKLRFVQGPLAQQPPAPPQPRTATEAPKSDPARQYQGAEGLKAALLALAAARAPLASTGKLPTKD